MTALIPDKIDFRVKTNTKKKRTLFKMIKIITHQGKIIILNIYIPNKRI